MRGPLVFSSAIREIDIFSVVIIILLVSGCDNRDYAGNYSRLPSETASLACPEARYQNISDQLRHFSINNKLQFEGREDTIDGRIFIITLRNVDGMYIIAKSKNAIELEYYSARSNGESNPTAWHPLVEHFEELC